MLRLHSPPLCRSPEAIAVASLLLSHCTYHLFISIQLVCKSGVSPSIKFHCAARGESLNQIVLPLRHRPHPSLGSRRQPAARTSANPCQHCLQSVFLRFP